MSGERLEEMMERAADHRPLKAFSLVKDHHVLICESCRSDWPCMVAALRARVAELDALRAELAAVVEVGKRVAEFLQSVEHKFDHCGAMNATQLAEMDHYRRVKAQLTDVLARAGQEGG